MNLGISFGVLAPPIKEQLEEQKLKLANEDNLEKYEKIKDAINILRLHRYIPDSQSDKCFKKLIKKICDEQFIELNQ